MFGVLESTASRFQRFGPALGFGVSDVITIEVPKLGGSMETKSTEYSLIRLQASDSNSDCCAYIAVAFKP